MTELFGDDGHWNAAHGELRGVRVPQDVKCDRGRYSGRLARLLERTLLMRRSPHATIISQKDVVAWKSSAGPCHEGEHALVGQGDVTDLALAQADRDRAAIQVEC